MSDKVFGRIRVHGDGTGKPFSVYFTPDSLEYEDMLRWRDDIDRAIHYYTHTIAPHIAKRERKEERQAEVWEDLGSTLYEMSRPENIEE